MFAKKKYKNVLFFFYYCSIVDLQCRISFRQHMGKKYSKIWEKIFKNGYMYMCSKDSLLYFRF